MIPVHRHLIAQGFLEFGDKRKGMPLLFNQKKLEDPKLTIHKTRAEGLAAWVGAIFHGKQKRVRPADETHVSPNHGWRHRFKTECRRIAMDRESGCTSRGTLSGWKARSAGSSRLTSPPPGWIFFLPYDVCGPSLKVECLAGATF